MRPTSTHDCLTLGHLGHLDHQDSPVTSLSAAADIRKQAYHELQAINSRVTRLKLSVKRRSLDSETQAREQSYAAAFAEGQILLERVQNLEASVEQLDIEAGDLAQLRARHAELDGELSVLYENVFRDGVGSANEDDAQSLVYAFKLQCEDVSCHPSVGRSR